MLGALHIGSDQAQAFLAEQINQMEQIASQVAVTVENLNLIEQTQRTLAELDAANRRLVGKAWSAYTQAGGLVAAEWRNGEWVTLRKQAPQVNSASGQALVPVAQTINLPVKVRGEVIGEFNVLADTPQAAWTTDDVAFAQTLIDQVSQVLENARLLEETERLAQREKAVADAAEKIHRATDIEAVLQSALTELNRITGQRGISIQLGFGRTEGQHHPANGNGQGADAEGER